MATTKAVLKVRHIFILSHLILGNQPVPFDTKRILHYNKDCIVGDELRIVSK